MDAGKSPRAKGVPEKPALTRITLLKSVLQGFRVRLDEELQPLGITTAQLRMLWTVAAHPEASGAALARLCFVTPQSGQATLTRLEAHGWVKRHHAAGQSERVLVAELTSRGRRLLERAREIGERVDRELWDGMGVQQLAATDAVLQHAVDALAGK